MVGVTVDECMRGAGFPFGRIAIFATSNNQIARISNVTLTALSVDQIVD
jgi:hypothetical protein